MFISKELKIFLSDLYHNRIAILCIIIYMSVTQYLFHSVCPIAILFGFPCPCLWSHAGWDQFLTAHFFNCFSDEPLHLSSDSILSLSLVFINIYSKKKPPYLTFITCLLGIIVFGIYILRLLTHTLPELPTNG